MTTLINDIKYAFRMLAKRPGFTFIAALVLALGIGANTALFSVIHGVLLSPGLFDEPERMMLVQTEYQGKHLWVLTGPDYLDFVERNTVFEGLSILRQTPLSLTGVGEPVALKGLNVTTNYFDVFGTSMLYGRAFHPREGEAGNDQVAVLSHGLWRDRFESDPAIVNRSITLDGRPYTVVGVAEPTLGFVEDAVHLYVPMQTLPLRQLHRDAHHFLVLGRLKRGVTHEQARAQMDLIAAQLASEHPDTNKDRGVRLTPVGEALVSGFRVAFVILYGAVTVLLLITCVNVSSLLVAKATARHQEIAIRCALGAGRLRIVQQLLTESVLLGLLGGAFGLLFAFCGLYLLRVITPRIGEIEIPGFAEIGVNLPILGFALLVSLGASLLFGAAPAWQGSRQGLGLTLNATRLSASHTRSRHRTLGTLVVAQVALALMLLTGAGLLIKSFARLQKIHPGFAKEHLLALSIERPKTPENTPLNAAAFFNRATERLSALPGVVSSGAISSRPLSSGVNYGITIRGKEETEGGAQFRTITHDYFHCLKIPLLQGRFFTEPNPRMGKEVIVNREFVRRYLSDRAPLGQVVNVGGADRTIVGIVENIKPWKLQNEQRIPYVYVPISQYGGHAMTLFLRTEGDPVQWANAARQAIWDIDPDQPILFVETMNQLVQSTISVERFCMILLTFMAGIALIMALVGLYGVMTFAVNERRNEIGIRLALGAQDRQILGLVLKRALILTVIGLGLGLVGALAVCRLMAGMLYGTSSHDITTFLLVPLILFGVATLACYLPARKATRLDPVEVLRYE